MDNKIIMNSEMDVKAVEKIVNNTEKTQPALNVVSTGAADYDAILNAGDAKRAEKALLKGKGTAEQYQQAGAYDVEIVILRRIDADMDSVSADINFKIQLWVGDQCIEYDFDKLNKVSQNFLSKFYKRINLPKFVEDFKKVGSMNSDEAFAMRNYHTSIGWCKFNGLNTFTYNSAVNADGYIDSAYRGGSIIECGEDSKPFWNKGDSDTFWKGMTDIIHNNPLLVLLIAASVSSVVLSFPGVNHPDSNLTMDVYGEQGTGKTTAIHLASAIWGDPYKLRYVPNSTSRSIEMELGIRGVIPTTVDDISSVAAGNRRFKDDLVNLVFAASQGKSYATCNNKSKYFYAPLLLTSEKALKQEILNGKTKGQNYRLIEICSNNPGFMDRETAKKIEKLIAGNYGHIMGFVKKILENGINADTLNDMMAEEIDVLEENFSDELTGRERFKNRLSLIMTCVKLLDTSFDMQIDIAAVRKVLIDCIVKQIPVIKQYSITGDKLYDIITEQFNNYRRYFAISRQRYNKEINAGYYEINNRTRDCFLFIHSDYLTELARGVTAADIAFDRPAENVIELTDDNVYEAFKELVVSGQACKRGVNSKNLTTERVVGDNGNLSKEHFYLFKIK